MTKEKIRCFWCGTDETYIKYHDTEWGVPCFDDKKLFEMLCLEGAQAGLSWITVLKKRENYRKAFDNFDAEKIAKYTPQKVEKLMQDAGIIRNRLKINAFILNAKTYLRIKKELGNKKDSFAKYLWQFVDHKQIVNNIKLKKQIQATSKESDAMSKQLKKDGFKFVGSTICYAFMQAVGMVDDHFSDCWKRSPTTVIKFK